MLHLCGPGPRLCDGLTRREFLSAGSLGLAGLALPALFHARAAAATPAARTKSVIQLFLWGGPSQHETFDLKPHAPEGVRGPFRPVETNVPGVRICEHLPRLAARADRYAVVRSLTHTGVNHGTSAYHVLTGHVHATPGTLRHPSPSDHPSVGCAAARLGRQPRELPSNVSLPSVLHDGDGGEVPGQGPGFLGQRYAPLLVNGDPTRRDFSIEALRLPADVDRPRLRDRIDLLSTVDHAHEELARQSAIRDTTAHYSRAFGLLQSPAT